MITDIDLAIDAKSGLPSSGRPAGQTTFAKLLTRLMDRPPLGPAGRALPRVVSSLRRRGCWGRGRVPVDATIVENVSLAGRAVDEDLELAFTELGLTDWVDGLPAGLATPVGERGESLSVGERQLVALVRAYVADPDLLVLDEATSAVDPATEVRLQRALDAVTRGRTTVVIAHRLATAEGADEVVVFDRGRIVQRGPHRTLVAQSDSVYARLHQAWLDQTR